MLTVSNQFPEFSLNSSEKDDLICKFSARYDEEGNFIHDRGGDVSKGKYMVIFSYPKDFTSYVLRS